MSDGSFVVSTHFNPSRLVGCKSSYSYEGNFRQVVSNRVKTHSQVQDETLAEFLVHYLGMAEDCILRGITSGRLRVKNVGWMRVGTFGADQFVVDGKVVFDVKECVAYKYWKGF